MYSRLLRRYAARLLRDRRRTTWTSALWYQAVRGIVDAVDAYAEGLQFKAIKVYERGVANRQFWEFSRDSIRASEMVLGDIEAQVAACRTGEQRLLEVVREYGVDQLLAASEHLMQYSEIMMRQAIAQVPDGVYSAEGHFDGFAEDPDEAKRDKKDQSDGYDQRQ